MYLFEDTSNLVSTALTSREEANAFAPSAPTSLHSRLRTRGREMVSQGWPSGGQEVISRGVRLTSNRSAPR